MGKLFIFLMFTVNAFLAGYAYGFHCHSVLVVDPNLVSDTPLTSMKLLQASVDKSKVVAKAQPSKFKPKSHVAKIALLPRPLFEPVPPYCREWPGRPVEFCKKTVNGVPLYLAVVDFSDPETFVSIGLAHNAAKANSNRETHGDEIFEAMVNRWRGAVVINGTFFSKDSQRRVMGNMVSGGKVLKYSQWEDYGTTCGLTAGNKLEMLTARMEGKPDVSKYWFAITCGPRLVSHGEDCVAATSEGFTDAHVLGVGPRVALGFPKSRDKLYLVSFLNGLSLVQEAKLMKDLGCFEAMNLDGGASKALAHNGDIIINASCPLTNVIVVYDTKHPAPQGLVDSWVQFQRQK